ncbi:MAG: hypothetical protein LUH07_04845, partial [Lachnospiraceae bacterium]|nr:hypothetical protein [Lachnospiraceae bacterium]
YNIWLAVLTVALVACSLGYWRILSLSAVCTTAIVLFVMTDFLCVLMLLTGNISFSGLTDRGEETRMPRRLRSLFALRQLAVFLISTILFCVYCASDYAFLPSNSAVDALVAGGLFCFATLYGASKKS